MSPLAPLPTVPCTHRPDLYDALLDHEPDSSAYQAANAAAVRVCSRCPEPCPEKVTPRSGPRTVADFDDTEWIPEPLPVVLLPVGPGRRRPEYFPPTGRDYVQPGRRPAVWARMAAQLAAEGRPLDAIALALCVSKDTVAALLTDYRTAA